MPTTNTRTQAVVDLLKACCKTGDFCYKMNQELMTELEEAEGAGDDDVIQVNFCRSPIAICNNNAVTALILDQRIEGCNLGELLQPFAASLMSLSCYECDLRG